MRELPADVIHMIDQTYAQALNDVHALVDDVTPWVAEDGPAIAAVRAGKMLRDQGWDRDMLAGLAGVTLVELIRAQAEQPDRS